MNLSMLVARLKSERRPVRFLVSQLLKRSHLCMLFMIHRDGYVLRFYPTSLSAALWADPMERKSDENVLGEFLQEGDTFVDVGANVGSLTLKAASLVGATGTVHCFEANPRTSRYLESNIRLNGMQKRVQSHCCALGENSGFIGFTAVRSDDTDHVADDGRITVPIHRMDDVLKDVARIALMKIDVEGYEVPVLRGSGRLLACTDVVYVESFEPQLQRYGFSTQELIRLLLTHGFAICRRVQGRWKHVSYDHISQNCENLLAVSTRASSKVKKLVTLRS